MKRPPRKISVTELADVMFKQVDDFCATAEEFDALHLYRTLNDRIAHRIDILLTNFMKAAQEILKDDGTQPTPKNTRKPKRRCKTDGTRTNAAGFDLGD